MGAGTRRRPGDPRGFPRRTPVVRVVLVAAVLATLGVVGLASGSPEQAAEAPARCKQGSVAAVIDGKRICLRRGQRCSKRLDRRYHRFAFHCHSGRLTGGPKPKPLPPAGKVVARIPVPSAGGIAAAAGSLWVASTFLHTVSRIDPSTGSVVATIPISDPALDPAHGPSFLAFGHGSVWVLDGGANCGCVHRIDPQTSVIVETISLGVPTQGRVAPLGIAVTPDAVWITNRWGSEFALDGSVMRIDPATNRVAAVIGLGSNPELGGPTGIAASADGVWVAVPSTKSVVRIDPATDAVVATIPGLTCAEGQLVVDESAVWVADCNGVRRIDIRTNAITKTIPIPQGTGYGARGVMVGLGSVWVQAGPLVRIDPASGALRGILELPPAYLWTEYDLELAFGSLWVRRTDQVIRIQP